MKTFCFLVFAVIGHSLAAQHYQEIHPGTIEGTSRSSVAFGDLDGDNDQDFWLIGYNDSTKISVIYLNDGKGKFTRNGQQFSGLNFGSVDFADVDNDGDADAFITGQKSGNGAASRISVLYINNGSGIFSADTRNTLPSSHWADADFFDADGDNDADLIITGMGGNPEWLSARLFLNDGTGLYTEKTTPLVPVQLSHIATADIENDGDQDIFITGSTSTKHRAIIYTNDGNANFTAQPEGDIVGLAEGSANFADLNNDGFPDLFVTGKKDNSESTSLLYLNDGNGRFVKDTATSFPGIMESSVDFADADRDGDLDMMFAGGGYARLYLNNGSGAFAHLPDSIFPGIYTGVTAFADVNNDSIPEIFITGYEFATSRGFSGIYAAFDPTSVLTRDGQNINLYPNPTRDVLHINCGSATLPRIELCITDLSGQRVRQYAGAGSQLSINIGDLAPGAYLVRLTDTQTTVVKKIVKE